MTSLNEGKKLKAAMKYLSPKLFDRVQKYAEEALAETKESERLLRAQAKGGLVTRARWISEEEMVYALEMIVGAIETVVDRARSLHHIQSDIDKA